MKTTLPKEITTVEEAKAFLSALVANGEQFHPEDSAHDIDWTSKGADAPTLAECNRMDILMSDIYELPESKKSEFDACAWLIWEERGSDLKSWPQQFENEALLIFWKNGGFEFGKEYEYVIEEGPDPYHPCWELHISLDDTLLDTFQYYYSGDADEPVADVELLQWLGVNIEEA